jgi:predicted Zn-dependent protease
MKLRSHGLSWALAVPWACLQACALPSAKKDAAPPGDRAAIEAEDAAANRGLRRMFPVIEGEITPASIAAEVERQADEADPSRGVRSDAIHAIREGDFERARDLLGELLAGGLLEHARAATAAGDHRGALAALDRALEVAPRSPSILCSRGEAVLALSASQAPNERDAKLLESARTNFLDAAGRDLGPNVARAWLGASLADRALGRLADASDHARRGIAATSAPGFEPNAARLADPLRRALAEAVFDDYAAARSAGMPADAVESRAHTTRDALEDLLARTPEEPWPWVRLADLAESQRAPAEARNLAANGLRIVPDDRALLARLAAASRALGGSEAAVEAFDRFCRDHPDVAPAAHELARALYDAAIEDSKQGRDPSARLSAAEAASAQCRRLAEAGGDAKLARSASEIAAEARGALGLWKLAHGDKAGAHTAFLSMEDATKGGLALEIPSVQVPGSTRNRGADGLFLVAKAYAERGELDGLEQAAKTCDLLHEVDPEDARFAAEAGTFHKESAILLELEARKLAGQGKRADAERELVRAREAMESAYKALADAARLAPEDERVLARAGEVLARYLQRDAPDAIAYLEKAVALGGTKLSKLRERAAEPGLADAERQARKKLLEDEEKLVGDACEDLGTTHLTLLGDAAKAREWLARSRSSGPDPRPGLEEEIARCDAAISSKSDPRLKDENRWAAPPPHGRTP